MSNKKIVIECKITAHASPRWKGAKNDSGRIEENEALARRRAEAVKRSFEQKIRAKLADYSIEFIDDQCLADEDDLPDKAVLIGSESRGQRDTIIDAKGERSNNDWIFRRVDMAVRIARKTEEYIPTTVKHRYKHPTKTRIWHVSAAASISLHFTVGVSVVFVELRNMDGQKATGIAYAFGPGIGKSGSSELARHAFKNKKKLQRAAVNASFGEEIRIVTDRDVGFEDFHARRVRYTSASIQFIAGYEWSYLTFYGLGKGAASVPVGGPSIAADAGASANSGEGHLFLIDVPSDWIIREMTWTEWDAVESDWVTEHSASVYFETGSSDIATANGEIDEFAAKISRDFRQH